MGLHSEAQLDRRFVEMARLLNVYLNHFPHHEKYGLAQEIRRAAYDAYGFIVEAFRRAARRGRMDAVVSSLGHARRTASLRHMTRHLKEHHHALYHQLPKSLRRHHHLPAHAA